jgi:hypothetical protein
VGGDGASLAVSGRAAGEGGSGEAEDAEAEAEAEYALPEEESDPECDGGERALKWDGRQHCAFLRIEIE